MHPAPQTAAPACPWPSHAPPAPIRLTVLPEHPCAYLTGRMARDRAFAASSLPPEMYHDLMDAGFRRSGRVFYQPICAGCRACLPIRIPVDRFAPSKSQRRSLRRNADLKVSVTRPDLTEEKFDLYQKYLELRHNGLMEDDRNSLELFLYDSPINTIEITYRNPAGRLIGVGICDLCARSLSGVYFYFDPKESKRSLGVFSTLYEINLARNLGVPWYYLGFWVKGCRTMEYKANYQPCEVFHPDGVWRKPAK